MRCDKDYLGLERFEKLPVKTEATMCIYPMATLTLFIDRCTSDRRHRKYAPNFKNCHSVSQLSFTKMLQKKQSTCCRNCLILHVI